jgi:nitroimidazol reductase NimA-like FMN-containing flavoprotein (pyridoxamine 5'-phosphate oxidase superfamily)
MNTERQDRVRCLIEDGKHMIVASADESGKPRVSPVFYSYDEEGALYWASSKNSRHSANIRVRPEIDLVIFTVDGDTDALYIEAEARELNDETEVAAATKIMQSRDQPERWRIKELANVTGGAAWRIYKATPKRRFLREETAESGQAVVKRAEI